MAEAHKALDHSLWEDALAFLLGTVLCALAVHFLTHLGLITGQTAGLSVLGSYLSPLSFSQVFVLVNLPFFLLALKRMGPRFTLKSVIAVGMVAVLVELLPSGFVIGYLHPALGAALAGVFSGLGLVVLFRHGGSLGGIGVLGLYLQDRTGFRAGWTQLSFDAVLFSVAFFVLDPALVLWSLAGALVTNLIIGFNHRKDRYIAT